MRLMPVLVIAAASLTACTQSAKPPALTTDDDKALYTLGAIVSRDLETFDFTDKELELVKAGFGDGARAQGKLKPEEMELLVPKLRELQATRIEAATKREKEAGAAYLAKAAGEAGALKTGSGLVYKAVTEGTGAAPGATDVVKVHYEGRLIDGKVFDSSLNREPLSFPLNAVIPCWTEGVQQMKVGGKAQLVCPPELAYGDGGQPPQIRGGATLVFDVELLDIVKEESASP